MLQNIKELYGNTLSASDGEIGHIKDFYFDDESWVVRYLIVDTGSWLTGQIVLLTPHSFGALDQSKKTLQIKLTKKQIEDSPSIDSHIPVSRQYEIEYYRYYNWPTYWEGSDMWGMGGYPMVMPTADDIKAAHKKFKHRADKHLRSSLTVDGYDIQTVDGPIGHISGFMVDDRSWAIQELVVQTGSWFSGKEVLISVSKIKRISYEESKVYVSLTKEDIQLTADHEISLHIH